MNKKSIDGGWAWIVLFGSFLMILIIDGIIFSFGHLYIEFNNYFEEERKSVGLIVSLLMTVTLCSGPITSILIQMYGCRPIILTGSIVAGLCLLISVFAQNVLTLIFTIGIGTGFGFGLIYLAAIVSVTMYFKEYRSLALGLTTSGSGIGLFVFEPLSVYVIKNYGWRVALLLFSFIVYDIVLFGALFRPLKLAIQVEKKPNEEDLESVEEVNVTDKFKCESLFQMWLLIKDPIFILFSSSYICYSLAIIIPFMLIGQRAELLNISTSEIAYLFPIIALTNICGRIIFGLICNIQRINRLYTFNVCFIICGISIIMSNFCENLYMVTIYLIVFGLTVGGCFGLAPVIIVDLFGLKNFTNALGIMMLFQGIGTFIGQSLTHWFLNYFTGSLFSGITITICGLILFSIHILKKKKCIMELADEYFDYDSILK